MAEGEVSFKGHFSRNERKDEKKKMVNNSLKTVRRTLDVKKDCSAERYYFEQKHSCGTYRRCEKKDAIL